MKNLLKKLTVFALVTMLMLSFAFTAMAKPTGDGELYDDVRVTKAFTFPEGATLPADVTFKYAVEYKGFEAHDKGSTDGGTVPEINVSALTFTNEMGKAEGGVVVAYKQSNNLLAGLKFEKAGIYEYHISERIDTVQPINPAGESMTYDNQVYKLKIFTKYNTITNEVIIDGGIVWKDNGEKVDPSPQKKPDETEVTEESNVEIQEANGFVFNNRYKKDAGFIDDKDTGLYVNKAVDGDYADLSKEFDFTITIKSDASTKGETITLEKADGTSESAIIGDTDHVFSKVSLKNAQTVKLKGIQVGATVTVAETDPDPYKVKIKAIVNGVPETEKEDTNWDGKLGEKNNQVDYTNIFESTAPMGIIINNLPYILLVAVALGGMALYFVSRRRKNENEG